MQGAGCCYSAALAPAPPSLSPARLSLSPGKLRTRRNTPPLSPPCRAPRRQSARCRVSGETWLPCVAASVPLWTVRAFGRPVQAWGSLLSGQRREEWRRASPQCEWAVNVNGVARSFWKPESLSSAENPKTATSGTFASVMALRSYYHGKVMPVGLIAGASSSLWWPKF
ncbi:uncharacterized protein LOC108302951 isoform X3 [Cebus imitator]|uniref:uncharacterized protein LOC108302951 isoform X3 n=1 Tax=Cebus imitator TaxID=2715852 RepID=UPI00189AF13A|nr:uncharacterized protein LOC108302951 isoform X3 [Cebus imitator]